MDLPRGSARPTSESERSSRGNPRGPSPPSVVRSRGRKPANHGANPRKSTPRRRKLAPGYLDFGLHAAGTHHGGYRRSLRDCLMLDFRLIAVENRPITGGSPAGRAPHPKIAGAPPRTPKRRPPCLLGQPSASARRRKVQNRRAHVN